MTRVRRGEKMRENKFQIRMDDEELSLLKEAAARAKMTMSEFARFLLVNGSRGLLADSEDEMRRAMNSTGTALYGRTVGRAYLPGLSLQGGKDEDDK